jgi:hypothetical protein
MNTYNNTKSLSTPITEVLAALFIPETHRLLELGRARGWDFDVLGKAPMPHEPVRTGKWLIMPADQDSSPIPARAQERLRAMYKAGLRPQGFVIVHEIPAQLPAPPQNEPNTLPSPSPAPEIGPLLKKGSGALGAVAKGMIAVTGMAALATAAVASLVVALGIPFAAFGVLMLVDPILIAVTEEGYWVEIDRWWD